MFSFHVGNKKDVNSGSNSLKEERDGEDQTRNMNIEALQGLGEPMTKASEDILSSFILY